MPPDLFSDEYLSCYFNVSLGSDLKGKFSSVSGLAYELEMETIYEGGRNDGPLLFPKSTKVQRLILEGGVLSSLQVGLWLRAASLGVFPRMTGLITLCDAKGVPVHGWMICDAYPVSYQGPALDAMKSMRALARVELVHTGLLQTF